MICWLHQIHCWLHQSHSRKYPVEIQLLFESLALQENDTSLTCRKPVSEIWSRSGCDPRGVYFNMVISSSICSKVVVIILHYSFLVMFEASEKMCRTWRHPTFFCSYYIGVTLELMNLFSSAITLDPSLLTKARMKMAWMGCILVLLLLELVLVIRLLAFVELAEGYKFLPLTI